jgi:hypothetical protein
MGSNIPEMIVMIRHILVSRSCTVLRMMLGAGVLAGCCERWGYDSRCGAGRMPENVDVDKQLMLICGLGMDLSLKGRVLLYKAEMK